ncbi:hypothetical protein SAMN05421747_10882 [Parapedobacter composti]|uniref:N-acetyltransferase domain-containing protein n=1 Tax=Parapedobacter composti TaxID=623281 RepID=A0A1I1I6Z6_9SPHI|nr:hypothetical protein [Parapedobacter composti]SFC31592.1 hypothetical protein SAMN05421747_10882 [Parapedobacter composti]
MISVVFRAFRAIDDPESCARFIEGHRKVLEVFGITMITSNKALWVNHKNTYVILVESKEDHRPLGGVRLQIADGELMLPIEDAVGKVDKKIHEVVKMRDSNVTGEMCGLWNSKEVAGFGIGSTFLSRATVALARMMKVKTLFALCAPATVRMGHNMGFVIEKSLGNNGFFNYPKLDLVATAMVMEDTEDISRATQDNQAFIIDFMKNPIQTRIEKGPKGEVRVYYDLSMGTLVK